MLGNERSWPELAEEFGNDGSGLPVDDPAWHARVSPLIEALWSPHPLARSRAMLRLFVPYRRGALTHEQIVLQLPELEPGLAEQAVRATVIGRVLGLQPSEGDWQALGAAGALTSPVRLGADAASLLDQLLRTNAGVVSEQHDQVASQLSGILLRDLGSTIRLPHSSSSCGSRATVGARSERLSPLTDFTSS